MPDPANPQDLNRFSYVRNNPLKYTDPTGHDPWWCQSASCVQSYSNSMANAGATAGGNGGSDREEDENITRDSRTGCNLNTYMNANGEYCHEYSSPPIVVCPAQYSCAESEMQAYLMMFQYPGQLPWNPVEDLESYTVFPFNSAPLLALLGPGFSPLSVALDQVLSPYGAITVDIADNGLAATNLTEPTHIFHEGRVDRVFSQLSDGSWVVTSYGTGTNSSLFIAIVNQEIGPATFQFGDSLMAAYIIFDQLTGRSP